MNKNTQLKFLIPENKLFEAKTLDMDEYFQFVLENLQYTFNNAEHQKNSEL